MAYSYSELNVVPIAKLGDRSPCGLLDNAAKGFSGVASSTRIRKVMRERNTQEIDLELVRRIDAGEPEHNDTKREVEESETIPDVARHMSAGG